jgi:hypothetical protein
MAGDERRFAYVASAPIAMTDKQDQPERSFVESEPLHVVEDGPSHELSSARPATTVFLFGTVRLRARMRTERTLGVSSEGGIFAGREPHGRGNLLTQRPRQSPD